MLVSEGASWGTIGGGQLEFMAIGNAREVLKGGGNETMDIPLGPAIGQCCGGRTQLRFRKITDELMAELETGRQTKRRSCRTSIFSAPAMLAMRWRMRSRRCRCRSPSSRRARKNSQTCRRKRRHG